MLNRKVLFAASAAVVLVGTLLDGGASAEFRKRMKPHAETSSALVQTTASLKKADLNNLFDQFAFRVKRRRGDVKAKADPCPSCGLAFRIKKKGDVKAKAAPCPSCGMAFRDKRRRTHLTASLDSSSSLQMAGRGIKEPHKPRRM